MEQCGAYICGIESGGRLPLKRPYNGDQDETRSSNSKRQKLEEEASTGSEFGIDSADGSDSDDEIESNATPATTLAESPRPSKTPPRRIKSHKCPYPTCGKSFNRPARLVEHQRSHTNSRIFVCPFEECSKDFLRRPHLDRHIKTAHSSVRDYECTFEECGKRFASGTRVRRHMDTVHRGKERFVCVDEDGFVGCGMTFRKHTTLARHIKTEHFGQRPFECDHIDEVTGNPCKAGYGTAHKLKLHIQRVHDSEERYWCTLCAPEDNASESTQTTFQNQTDLQTHIQLVHPPRCSICELTFWGPAELKSHNSIHHSGLSLADRKIFVCEHSGCGKSFTKQSNLNIHIRGNHSTEKPFKCGTTDLSSTPGLKNWDSLSAGCGQGFTSKRCLEDHVRRKHISASQGSAGSKKEQRKEKKAQKKSEMSAAAILTGLEAEEARSAAPALEICSSSLPYQTTRGLANDLGATAEQRRVDEACVFETLAEHEALAGGRFWIGADVDELAGADIDNIDPDLPHL